MSALEAVTLYTGLLALLFLALKINTGRVRSGESISIGDGGSENMQRAMRVQANAIEDVPIVLLGLYGLAALAAPVMLIHALGGGLVFARLLHALGMGGAPGFGKGRMIGTLASVLILLITGGACLWYALV